MKLNKTPLLACVLLVSGFLHAQVEDPFGDVIEVTVEGMDCARCSARLEKSFSKLEGVQKVAVDLETGIARITVHQGEQLPDEKIKNTVEDNGFVVKAIKHLDEKGSAGMQTIKLKVSGMFCSGCVKNVKAALERVPPVREADVDIDSQTAIVTVEKGKVNAEQLIEAVEKSGRFKASVEDTE